MRRRALSATTWAIGNTIYGDTSVKTVWLGAGLLTTTATDGFVEISGSAGTPTGTPTAHSGYTPIEIDTSNNKISLL